MRCFKNNAMPIKISFFVGVNQSEAYISWWNLTYGAVYSFLKHVPLKVIGE